MRHVYWLVFILVAACGDDPEIDFTATVMPVSTPEDTPASFSIEANLPATFQLTTAPAHGTVTGEGTAWTYTPEANYFGADALTITATEGATVIELPVPIAVTAVNDAPVAAPDSFATNADNPLAIDVASILANDTDLEGDTLSVTAASNAVSGGAVLDGNTITFTPTTGFAGMATFDYTVSDGTATATGSVTVAVGVAQAITATDDSASTNEDVAFTIPIATLLGNDIDPDGHILSITDVQNAVKCTAVKVGTAISVTPDPDANGQATFEYVATDGALTDTATVTVTISPVPDAPVANPDTATTDEDTPLQIAAATLLGNDTDADNDALTVTAVSGTGVSLASNTITFAPTANFNGNATFQYTISDGNGGTSTGTVTVTVAPVPDAPVANPDAMTIAEDGVATVDVLANDTDADGDTVLVASFGQPAHGVVNITGGIATYTPVGNFTGPDSFTYLIDDGTGRTATGTVSINVTPVNDAPVAVDDVVNVAEETPTVIPATANDIDVDGDTLVFSAVTQPLHGTVQLAGGIVTYTPALNYVGPDGFDYTVSDGNNGTDVGHVTINVTNVNDAPVANADVLGTDENTVVTANVVANDTDADGDTLSVTTFTQGAHGSVTFAGPSATYTPANNFSGEDAFTYTISDGKGGTSTGTVTVFVGLDNDPPVAVDDTATVVEETPTTISVLGNDSDIDLNPLVVSAVTAAEHGTVVLNNGVITYTPNDNYFGPDGFDYVVSDGLGGSDIGHVTINVTNVNDTPVAVNDTLTTNEDTLATLNVTLNDTDIDGDTLAIQSSTQPAHGTLVFVATVARYTPALNYNGPDSFTYTVTDGNGGTATATVTVTVNAVNDAPVAGDDARTVVEETPFNFVTLLGNDNDVDGDPLTITAVTTAAHGTVVLNANGSITYSPATNYFGPDAFDYTISDGKGGTDVGRVNITVTNVNDVPVAVNDTLSTNEDVPKSVNVVLNDTDVDGDTLSIQTFTQPATGGTVTFAGTTATFLPSPNFNGTTSFTYTVKDPSNATSTATVNVTVVAVNDAPVAGDDTITTAEDTQSAPLILTANDTDVDTGQTLNVTSNTNAANGTVVRTGNSVRYTPNANFNGTDSFNYTVSDGNGGSDTATVTITVTPVNDPPNAVNDTATVAEDANDTVINVKNNDTDIENDSLTVTAVTQPANGTATLTAGAVSFKPNANFNGTTSFNYTLSDGNGGTDTASVTVTVTAVNDPPDAVDDSATVAEDAAATIINVKTNDTDVDLDTLTVTAITQPANGTATLASGVVRFQPAANFNGSTTFTYTLSDNNGGTDTATVTMTVTPVNDAPNAVNDAVTVAEDANDTVINVKANDDDIDGDPLTVTAVTQPANGTATLSAGVVSFQPAANFNGTTSFTYTLSDGNGGVDTATVTVTVSAVNDPPNAVNDTATVAEDANDTVIDVKNNDTDVDAGTTLTVTAVTQPANGTATLASGVVSFKPAANFAGTTTFGYTLSDNNGGTDTATVTVTVTPVNDLPIANNDSITVAEDSNTTTVDVLANDTDVEGALTVTAITQPANGTATLVGGVVSFKPNANFGGSTSFTYTVTDSNSATDTATVSVTVTAAADLPIANNDSASVNEDALATVVNVLANDSDADGDTITVTAVGAAGNGITTLTSGVVRYRPNANFNGTDTFNYTITANGDTDTATVTVTVSAQPDLPIAQNDSITVAEGSGATVVNVLANDSDADGDVISVTSAGPATNGSVTLVNGVVRYQPNAGFDGIDSFSYTITANGNTATALVSVTVTSTNTAPIAQSTDASSSGEIVTIVLSGSDADGDKLSFAIASGPGAGSLGTITQLDDTTAQVDYDPGSFVGTTSFTFTVNDGTATSLPATVDITVKGCGDGIIDIDLGEECDDDNQTPNDGCEANCTFTCGSNGDNIIPTAVEVDQVTGHCFARYDDQAIDFDAAFETCGFAGGHLATVTSSSEHDAVLKVTQANEAWLGGTDVQEESDFLWVTGEAFSFNGFASPPDGGTNENCILTTGAGWFDADCDKQIQYICEFNDTLPTGKCGDGNLDPDEECDDNNLLNGDGCEDSCKLTCGSGTGAEVAKVDGQTGNCFAFYPGNVNAGLAAQLCSTIPNNNAHLATGATGGEQAAILATLQAASIPIAWIGADDNVDEGKFAWINNEGPVDPTGFAPGEGGGGQTENCLIGLTAGWADVNCDAPQPATLCEFEGVVPTAITPFAPGSAAAIVIENLSRHGTLGNPGR